MKRKVLFWIVGVLFCLVSGVWLYTRMLANQDEAEFQHQLRLARAVGLPTNAAEFAATIKPAAPADNAAPIYRDLRPVLSKFWIDSKPLGEIGKVQRALLRDPSGQPLKVAEAFVNAAKTPLELIDRAAAKPRCWFNRNWSDGEAVLMPEFADMKSAARLLELRGTTLAAKEDERDALASPREVFVVSRHAAEEGTTISAMVGETVYSIGLHTLAEYCFLSPRQSVYRQALETALRNQPTPDYQRENRDRLFMVLSTIDLCSTEEGRKKLGLRDDDMPPTTNLFSVILSQPKAKVSIVKAEREYWTALNLPVGERSKAISTAEMNQNMALLAFPLAAKLYTEFGGSDDSFRDPMRTLRRMEFTAILRATTGGGIARSIVSDDLKSPFDDDPLTYSYDGKQIRIAIDGEGGRPYKLDIPADEPSKR